jgi:hypothetical protein
MNYENLNIKLPPAHANFGMMTGITGVIAQCAAHMLPT